MTREAASYEKYFTTGSRNGMRGMQGTRGMFTRIPGNLLEYSGNVIILTFQGMFQRIPGNVEEDFWKCSRGFRGMFHKIPGNVRRYSGECSPGNGQEDSGEC